MLNVSAVIQQNNTKVYLYMVLMTMVIGLLGHFISMTFNFGLTGTGVFLILAGLYNILAYYFSDWLILRSSHAKPITEEAIPEYTAIVKKLALKAGIPMPKLYVIHEDAINAFATGRNQKKAVVVVTRGLLEKLTPDETAGVIAHELAHIQYNDMFLMAVISVLTGLISIFADIFWFNNLMSQAESRDRSGAIAIIGVILALFAPLASVFVKLAISRKREYNADARGAELTGNPNFLIGALEKIKRDQVPLPRANRAMAHLYIASPFKGGGLEEFMSTHPDIDKRIEALKALMS
jgi:heat shock protein HtpX